MLPSQLEKDIFVGRTESINKLVLLVTVCNCREHIFQPSCPRPRAISFQQRILSWFFELSWNQGKFEFHKFFLKWQLSLFSWTEQLTTRPHATSFRIGFVYLSGMGPRIFSIMARCSRLSWVWNRVKPRYSSNIMQPTLHTSHGCDQPNSVRKKIKSLLSTFSLIHSVSSPNITSGAL